MTRTTTHSESLRARNAGGMTMIELVVAVTIVSVAVVVLVLATAVARQSSLRAGCSANLRQIGIAAATYAADNHRALPIYHAESGVVFDTFCMRRPDTGQTVNLGVLLRYAPVPQMYYCPSQDARTSPSIAWNTPQNRWQDSAADAPDARGPGTPTPPTTAPALIRPGVNASFTARFRNPSDPAAPNWAILNYANKVIYSDFIGVDQWAGRGRFRNRLCAPHDRNGYNRLFGDGSVLWAQPDTLEQLRPIGPSEPTAAELNDYYELLDVMP